MQNYTRPGNKDKKSIIIAQSLRQLINPEKAAFYPRFFKTGPGQYGEGDKFLGITVPLIRSVVQAHKDVTLAETLELLKSPYHEDRLCALLLMVRLYQKSKDDNFHQELYNSYLANTQHINNWDLVDLSAEHIIGAYLYNHPEHLNRLDQLAHSISLWERRIAVLSTFTFIKKQETPPALHIIDILLHDKHDLIHKATGWMLREIGKRVDRQTLLDYLNLHATTMPRTTLRYAIEHLTPAQKAHYIGKKL